MSFERATQIHGWGELINFADNLPLDSRTVYAKNREVFDFASDLKRNAILADIYDAIAMFLHSFGKVHGSKSPKPKPYKRPWLSESEHHIGRGAIPISEFEKWYYGGE